MQMKVSKSMTPYKTFDRMIFERILDSTSSRRNKS
jgi:hypothetical protein